MSKGFLISVTRAFCKDEAPLPLDPSILFSVPVAKMAYRGSNSHHLDTEMIFCSIKMSPLRGGQSAMIHHCQAERILGLLITALVIGCGTVDETANLPSKASPTPASDSTVNDTPASRAADSDLANSPATVFKTYADARSTDDWKAAFRCMTADMQQMEVGKLVVIVNLIALQDPDQAPTIQAAFRRYGVDTRPLDPEDGKPPTPKQAFADMKRTAAKVADKGACQAELWALLKRSIDNPTQDTGKMSLSDLRVDGDDAMGTVTTVSGEKRNSHAVKFKKVDNRWLIQQLGPVPN